MIESIALIIIVGLTLSFLTTKVKLPPLIGFLISGIILGPQILNLIDDAILDISLELRKIALIIILFRAGLTLNFKSLREIGKVSFLLSFIPATLEIIAITLFANIFLNFSIQSALLLATVIAAASPAVIVPKMIDLINKKRGRDGLIPKMIMTSAAVEDVVVIIFFAAALELNISGTANYSVMLLLPLQILIGAIIGYLIGFGISVLMSKFRINSVNLILIILAVSFLLVRGEELNDFAINYSGLIAVMMVGLSLSKYQKNNCDKIAQSFSSLWIFAQILLFVLIGASIQIAGTIDKLGIAIIIICIGLIARFIGVFISFVNTNFNKSEKTFTIVSFIPKATVQAAIGGIALASNLENGEFILSVAVISILVTAPIGAILIDKFSNKL